MPGNGGPVDPNRPAPEFENILWLSTTPRFSNRIIEKG